jgi:PAS domain S-box-containing protein
VRSRFDPRWLSLTVPAYGALALGRDGWPLVAALAGAVVAYVWTVRAAERRWPEWARRRALFLRLAEIGLACIALSLLYLESGKMPSAVADFYYDGFYAVFVILAAVAAGRRGAVASVVLATLAVAYGQVVQMPAAAVLWGPGAGEVWAAVGGYALIYAAFFAVMATLARFAVEFQGRLARWNTLVRLARDLVPLQDAVLVMDAHGRITSANAAAERLFGPAAAMWGRPVSAWLLGPLPFETEEPIAVAGRRADGSAFDAEVSLSTYRSEEGEVVARVAVVRDASARRREAEAAARAARRESLERLAAGLADELEGPLEAIAATAESLAEDAPAAGARESLARVAAEARRVRELVRDLAAFGRQGDAPGPGAAAVSVNDVVRRALAARAPAAPDRVTAVEELGSDLPPVVGVAADLERALVRVLENAERAVAEAGGGTIRVRTYATWRADGDAASGAGMPEERVVIEVEDAGGGIPPLVLERIFDPFFTTRPGAAPGLGLSVVHGIVARHRGVVRVSSRPGAGTRVCLEFPAARAWAAALLT